MINLKNTIINYIQKLKKEDIIIFCQKQNITISDKELDTIYYYIKNHYQEIFTNPNKILDELKQNLSKNTYNKVLELYEKYKIFI